MLLSIPQQSPVILEALHSFPLLLRSSLQAPLFIRIGYGVITVGLYIWWIKTTIKVWGMYIFSPSIIDFRLPPKAQHCLYTLLVWIISCGGGVVVLRHWRFDTRIFVVPNAWTLRIFDPGYLTKILVFFCAHIFLMTVVIVYIFTIFWTHFDVFSCTVYSFHRRVVNLDISYLCNHLNCVIWL